MAKNTPSSTIVLELLRDDNYANWSASMKNYLLAQDLWDVVEATMEPPNPEDGEVEFNEWRKSNAAALHAIQISCEVHILSKIREINSAEMVWYKLATMYGPIINSPNILGNSSPNNTCSINYDLLDQYERLRMAINSGDWDAASDFLRRQEDATSAKISDHGRTVLHVAVFAGYTEIVQKLVELMSAEELEIRDDEGFTALAQAAVLQNIRMVECMLRKNTNLLNILDKEKRIPLIAALEYGNIEVARYLYSASLPCQILSDFDGSMVLTLFILLNQFDLALHLLHRYPLAAILPNIKNTYALGALASMSSAFPSGNKLVFWKNWIYACIPIRSGHCTNDIQLVIHINPNEHQGIIRSVLGLLRRLSSNLLKLLGIKQIYEMKLLHHQARDLLSEMCNEVKKMKDDVVIRAMSEATKGGIFEFIDNLVNADQSLLHHLDRMGRNIFFYAVLHRQPKIFSLIYKLKAKNSITNVVDKSGNTILHMAAMLEPSTTRDRIPGDALKMQSEVQWFKEVESICPLWIKVFPNDKNRTPKELFTDEHKDMVKKGEQWMKDTATSCTVIGALIITIMFTAAFNVPGGNNQTTGFPMFADKKLFTIFIISDVLSLFCSSTSVSVFLGILTSRYEEDDFLRSLPTKMITGLLTLLFSIATMMMAFCAGLFILLPGKSWMTIPIICLAIVTVILFGFMQFPILFDMIKSSYGPSIFNRTNYNCFCSIFFRKKLSFLVKTNLLRSFWPFSSGCCLGQSWWQDRRLSKPDLLSSPRLRLPCVPPTSSLASQLFTSVLHAATRQPCATTCPPRAAV